MSIYRLNPKPGEEPNKWPVTKVADIEGDEPFVKGIRDFLPVVDASTIYEPERTQVKDAIMSILMDGLMPAFLELRRIRESVGKDVPLMNRMQPYEDLARKSWRAYKELTQKAVRLMGFKIDFIFDNDKKFHEGAKRFREDNPDLRSDFESFLEGNRTGWQNQLARFRNNWLEHPHDDPGQYKDFYRSEQAEALFECVWKTIADLLPPLLELRLPFGIKLVEQHPNDPNPRWPQRFRYEHPSFKDLK
jgi:hypothetical protein